MQMKNKAALQDAQEQLPFKTAAALPKRLLHWSTQYIQVFIVEKTVTTLISYIIERLPL